jgi:hypothetical protein
VAKQDEESRYWRIRILIDSLKAGFLIAWEVIKER